MVAWYQLWAQLHPIMAVLPCPSQWMIGRWQEWLSLDWRLGWST